MWPVAKPLSTLDVKAVVLPSQFRTPHNHYPGKGRKARMKTTIIGLALLVGDTCFGGNITQTQADACLSSSTCSQASSGMLSNGFGTTTFSRRAILAG